MRFAVERGACRATARSTSRPFSRCNSRWARSAACGSCVTMMIVLFKCSRSMASRSSISSADFESKSPVGSSATINVGSVTIARAMPTRCCWPPDSCPGRCDQAIRKADEVEGRQHLSACRSAAESGSSKQRQLDILVGRQHGQQVVELEDEADVPRPPAGELAFGHRRDFGVADADFAGRRLVEPGDQVEQRRLARAGRPHEREKFAGGDVERQVVQDLDRLAAAHERLVQVRARGRSARWPCYPTR